MGLYSITQQIDHTKAINQVVTWIFPRIVLLGLSIGSDHADLVSETTLTKMAELGIGGNFNPEIKHLVADSQVESLGLSVPPTQ